jgi:flagellar basal-body rod protein FlgF
MDSALYTAYSGLRATSDMLDVLSNNLANVNTTGFKGDEVFLRVYNRALSAEGATVLDGALNASSVAQGTRSNFAPGPITTTGRDLDIALDGKGFLVVQSPAGMYYTRNGNMHLDPKGRLVNSDGLPLMGQRGPIELPPGLVAISKSGGVEVNGTVVDTLKIVSFADTARLEKVGNSAFKTDGPEILLADADRPAVRQGTLERSNVNPIREMMLMISVTRQFEALQKSIYSMMNTVNDRSINQVGRVTG